MFASPVIYPAAWCRYNGNGSLMLVAGIIEGFRASLTGHSFDWLHVSISAASPSRCSSFPFISSGGLKTLCRRSLVVIMKPASRLKISASATIGGLHRLHDVSRDDSGVVTAPFRKLRAARQQTLWALRMSIWKSDKASWSASSVTTARKSTSKILCE